MQMVEDKQFSKLIEYKKYKDLFDVKSVEFWAAILGSICISTIVIHAIEGNEIDNINTLFIALTKDIAVALISFLGFTVSGLAILTGVISRKEVQAVANAKKLINLEKILMSFYLLGIVIAVTIIGLICAFIMSTCNMRYSLKGVRFLAFIFSYLIIFILFYSVKLIGNSLEIFFIVNSTQEQNVVKVDEARQIYDSYRLAALERVYFLSNPVSVESYKKTLADRIKSMNDESMKYALKELYRQHFKDNI